MRRKLESMTPEALPAATAYAEVLRTRWCRVEVAHDKSHDVADLEACAQQDGLNKPSTALTINVSLGMGSVSFASTPSAAFAVTVRETGTCALSASMIGLLRRLHSTVGT